MWTWIKKNVFTKKVLGVAVGAAGAFYPPLLPVSLLLGGLIAGSDFQVGSQIGTPLGKEAKKIVDDIKSRK